MPQPLWSPSAAQVTNSRMDTFRRQVNEQFGLSLGDYAQLHDWSVNQPADFWASLLVFLGSASGHPPAVSSTKALICPRHAGSAAQH